MAPAACSGSKVELVVEDDQTNPEAAVRAAHKLIEVDKVPVIMGTWASAVTRRWRRCAGRARRS